MKGKDGVVEPPHKIDRPEIGVFTYGAGTYKFDTSFVFFEKKYIFGRGLGMHILRPTIEYYEGELEPIARIPDEITNSAVSLATDIENAAKSYARIFFDRGKKDDSWIGYAAAAAAICSAILLILTITGKNGGVLIG